MVVFLGDRVLGGKPQILSLVQGVLEAAPGKGGNGVVLVVLPLEYTGSLEAEDHGFFRAAGIRLEDQAGSTGFRDPHFLVAVHIPVGMTGNRDGFLPVFHHRIDAFDHDRRAEHRAVQDRPDRAVGGFPHFAQVVLLDTLRIGGDGGTLHSDTQPLAGLGGIHRDLVLRGFPGGQAQVIVFGLQVDIGLQQDFLDVLPQDTGHFVPVHLHQRGFHLNFHASLLYVLRVAPREKFFKKT